VANENETCGPDLHTKDVHKHNMLATERERILTLGDGCKRFVGAGLSERGSYV